MNRKQFLTRSLQLCVGCGTLAAIGPSPAGASEESKPSGEVAPADDNKKAAFITGWVGDFVKTVDSQLDEQQRITFMQANGRACAARGALKAFEQYRGNLDGLLTLLRSEFGEERVQRQGDAITMSWGECLCPLVKDGPKRLSDTYCHCSQGWFLEVFEMVTGKAVQVDLIETIRRGGSQCKVTVRV